MGSADDNLTTAKSINNDSFWESFHEFLSIFVLIFPKFKIKIIKNFIKISHTKNLF